MGNLIHTIEEVPKDKKLIVFDLDGTLAESKAPIDPVMGSLLARLLARHKVAIIGGASFAQLTSQLPAEMMENNYVLANLFLLPLDGGAFYIYKDNGWQNVYMQSLTAEEKKKIFDAFEMAFKATGYVQPSRVYGEVIEDRGSQVTFSALGQQAPLEEKEKWLKEKNDERLELVPKLRDHLPDMEITVAGLTSIDVTKKGIDKKFGIEQLLRHLNISADEALYVGDALGPDGNDAPALESGVLCFEVKSITDTKNLIEYLLG